MSHGPMGRMMFTIIGAIAAFGIVADSERVTVGPRRGQYL
jgi:hypothetical protein